ncbi:DUF4919 domain-containing protein [Alistipes sp. AF48-12]|jgi:hypothetical protein|uniref:DUF4919 domain-containing protein n=1 Tax=Alistipes sp. AF48-12 TaxID=2291998 RepID=UPI0011C38BA3|nr:DUF4919 domain-containing protein [Alistipes sp. AF48-12]
MKKLSILSLTVLLLTNSYRAQARSQETKTITTETIMKKFLTTVPGDSVATDSPNTYNQLLARFEQADTTLTPWECAEIYYGFARQSNYKGLVGNGESEAHKLLQLGKYQEAFDQAKSILHECPTSLGAHEILLAVSDVCKLPPEETEPYRKRFRMLLQGIWTSGDGRTKETAFKILGIPDEYVILRVLNVTKTIRGESLDREGYLETKIKAEGIPDGKLYFDIKIPLEDRRQKLMKGRNKTE